MARAIESLTTSRFHNLSDSALADELGHADALAPLKFILEGFAFGFGVAGSEFTVTCPAATEQIAGRLDVKAVKDYLGKPYRRFEVATVSTVIRIKAIQRLATAA
jgi:hypothetical protein